MAGTVIFKSGDTETITITFENADGTAVNITGKSVKFMIKQSLSDDDADAIYSTTITSHSDPTAGETSKEIAASVTSLWEPGEYKWQARLLDGSIVQSTDVGPCIIEENLMDDETTTTTTA